MTKEAACRTCYEVLPMTQFWPSSKKRMDGTRGFQTECKACMRARNTKWGQKHADKRRRVNTPLCRALRKADPLRSTFAQARVRAEKRGLEFTLKRADLTIPKVCPVLGIPINTGVGTGSRSDNSPSLDRRDNSRGYTPDNVVVVSWRANRLKNDATPDELVALARFYGGVE